MSHTENLDLEKRILTKIDELKKEITRFHQQIIRIPSENPPGKYKEISTFVEKEFKTLGLAPINKRNNVIGTFGNSNDPSLILYSHMDTVEAFKGWTKDPFGGELINNKIYGRGSCDDKACLTACLFATKVLIDLEIPFSGKLTLLSVVDEEMGGMGEQN